MCGHQELANCRLFGLPEKTQVSCVRLHTCIEIAFWKNSECFSANRLQNGENTNVNKALLLTPIPSLSSPNVKST